MKTNIPTDRLKDLLKAQGKNAAWLADAIDTSRPHMSRILNNKSPLTMEWVLKSAKALKVRPHDIAGIHLSRKISTSVDDMTLGSILGWLFEATAGTKTSLSQQELGKLATFI
jgi:plasmid maintenance system antidote protein VapI